MSGINNSIMFWKLTAYQQHAHVFDMQPEEEIIFRFRIMKRELEELIKYYKDESIHDYNIIDLLETLNTKLKIFLMEVNALER